MNVKHWAGKMPAFYLIKGFVFEKVRTLQYYIR